MNRRNFDYCMQPNVFFLKNVSLQFLHRIGEDHPSIRFLHQTDTKMNFYI